MTAIMADDFARADGADLGSAATGQLWYGTGAEPPYLDGGTLTGDGNGYAYLDAERVPYRVHGIVSWDADGGDADGSVTIDISKLPGVDPGLHFHVERTSWSLILWPGTPGVNMGGYPDGLGGWVTLDTGVQYAVGMRVNGNTLTLELPDGNEHVVTDAKVSERHGQHLFFQVHFDPLLNARPRWHSVWADVQALPVLPILLESGVPLAMEGTP